MPTPRIPRKRASRNTLEDLEREFGIAPSDPLTELERELGIQPLPLSLPPAVVMAERPEPEKPLSLPPVVVRGRAPTTNNPSVRTGLVVPRGGGSEWGDEDMPPAAPAPSRRVARMDEFSRSIERTAARTMGDIAGGVETVLGGRDNPSLTAIPRRIRKLGQSHAASLPEPKVASAGDVTGVRTGLQYGAQKLGEALTSTVPLAVAAVFTGGAGAFALGSAMAAGAIRTDLEELGVNDEGTIRAVTAVVAPIVAGLDTRLPASVAKQMLRAQTTAALRRIGWKGAVAQVTKSAVKGGAQEAVTEVAQEGVQYGGTRTAAGKPMSWEEFAPRAVEAAIGGAIGGTTIGGAGGTVEAGTKNRRVEATNRGYDAQAEAMGLGAAARRPESPKPSEPDAVPSTPAPPEAPGPIVTHVPEQAPPEHRAAAAQLEQVPPGTILRADDPTIAYRPEDARPTQTYYMHTADIERDPAIMQYKGGVDSRGVTDKLAKAERFNPQLSPPLYVWHQPETGHVLVANGHHRHELAERTGYPVLEVKFLEAATAKEARGMAALQNIGEGMGTAIDAGRFFRETGKTREDVRAAGIPMTGSLAGRGMALTALSDEVFDLVNRGVVQENQGVLIGQTLQDPANQMAAAKLLATEAGRELTQAQVQEVLEDIRRTGTEKVFVDDMFGGKENAESIILERARVIDGIRRRLRSQRALLNTVANEVKAEILQSRGVASVNVTEAEAQAQALTKLDEALTLVSHDPQSPVFTLLSDAARRVKNGEPTDRAIAAVEADVLSALRSVFGRRVAAGDVAGAGAGGEGRAPVGAGVAAAGAEEGVEAPPPPDPNQAALFSPLVVREGEDVTKTPEFRRWFGDSKVLDQWGDPLVLYHQTSKEAEPAIEREGFDLGKGRARLGDEVMPDGIFLKPGTTDIGLGAAEPEQTAQIPLFARIENPLRIADRDALSKWLANRDPEYELLAAAATGYDRTTKAEYDAWDEAERAKVRALPQEEQRPAYRAYLDEAKVRIDRWIADNQQRATAARVRATQVIREAGHDGVIVEKDVGSWGRKTKTYVVFEPTQVKAVYKNAGTFDPADPSIVREQSRDSYEAGRAREIADEAKRLDVRAEGLAGTTTLPSNPEVTLGMITDANLEGMLANLDLLAQGDPADPMTRLFQADQIFLLQERADRRRRALGGNRVQERAEPERILKPVVRIPKKGKKGYTIVEGRYHGEAWDNAIKQGLIDRLELTAEQDEGFSTTGRKFVDRSTAYEIADRADQLRYEPGATLATEDLEEIGPIGEKAWRGEDTSGIGVREVVQGMSRPSDSWGVPEAAPLTADQEIAALRAAGETKAADNLERFMEGSVVRQRVYHATGEPENFDVFDRTMDIGYHFGSSIASNMRAEVFFGWPDERPRTLPVFLNIKNPLRLPDMGDWAPGAVRNQLEDMGIISGEEAAVVDLVDTDRVQRWLAKKGFDGIVYENTQEGGGDSYIVFRPQQIKSAIGNRGTFSRRSPSMVNEEMSQTYAQNIPSQGVEGTAVIDENTGEPVRVYHGTTLAFDRFDTTRSNSISGWGPGLYFSTVPAVGNAYAMNTERLPEGRRVMTDEDIDTQIESHRRAIQYAEGKRAENPTLAAEMIADQEKTIAKLEAMKQLPFVEPNVRIARLLIRKPFRANEPWLGSELNAMLKRAGFDNPPIFGENEVVRGHIAYQTVIEEAGSLAEATEAIKRAGYDGIRGTSDVWVAFDPSQVRSAWGDPKAAAIVGEARSWPKNDYNALEKIAHNPQLELELAFGSEAAAAEAVDELLELTAPEFVTGSLPYGVKTTGEQLKNMSAAKRRNASAWTTLRGRNVKDLSDLIRFLQPFRSPKFEYLHYLFLNDNGDIVSHSVTTSGAIDFVVWAKDASGARERAELAARAKRAGATKLVVAHNHPSGDPTPSTPDLVTTRIIGMEMAKHGIDVNHLVIDHRHGIMITTDRLTRGGEIDGQAYISAPPDVQNAPDWTQATALNAPLNTSERHARGPLNVWAAIKDVWHTPLGIVYLDVKHNIIAYAPHKASAIATMGTWLPQHITAHGAAEAIVITEEGHPRMKAVGVINELRQKGKGERILDVISYLGGDKIRSASENFDIKGVGRPAKPDVGRRLFEQPADDRARDERLSLEKKKLLTELMSAQTPADRARIIGRIKSVDQQRAMGRPTMKGAITQTEMAERAKRGETKKAVESLTGLEPVEQSRDRSQLSLVDDADLEAGLPLADSDARGGRFGNDQSSLFNPMMAPTPAAAAMRQAVGLRIAPATKAKAQIEISRELARAIGIPLNQGRFMSALRRAAGVYFPFQETIRVLRFDHVATVAHEVGHHVSKKQLRNPTMKGAKARDAAPITKAMKDELVAMGKRLYGTRKPAGGYGEEGIAEWFKFYVTDPVRAEREAPDFSAFMYGTVLPAVPHLRQSLDQARDDFTTYTNSSAASRIDAILTVKERVRSAPSARDIIVNWYDDLIDWRNAVDQLRERRGVKKLPARLHAYILARLTRGDPGLADEQVRRGVIDFNTRERVTEGIQEILERIPAHRMQAFRRYLIAERVLEVAARGIETGVTTKDAQEIVDQTASEFRQHAEGFWEISKALLRQRLDAGLLTNANYKAVLDANQRRVPLYRAFEDIVDGEVDRRGKGGKWVASASGLMKMKGSARPIYDPIEGLIQDVYRTTVQVQRAHAAQTLIRQVIKTEGAGDIIEEVAKPQQLVQLSVERIIEQLRDLGLFPEGASILQSSSGGIAVELKDKTLIDLTDEVVQAFNFRNNETGADRRDLVLPALIDGEIRWFKIQKPELYDAMKGLNREEMGVVVRFAAPTTRLLRAGATLSLEFIVRNPIRDMFTAAIRTRAKGVPPPGLHFARGLFHVLRQDKLFQQWRIDEGDTAAMLTLDRQQLRSHVEKLTRTREKRAGDIVIHPLDTLRLLSSVFENATRVGEYEAVTKRRRKEGEAELDARVEGSLAGRDISVDFNMAGLLGRPTNSIIAFFNATLQGPYLMAQDFRHRPQIVIPRALAWITLPSMLLYYLQKDDEAYQEVPRWMKDIFWVIIDRSKEQPTDLGPLTKVYQDPKTGEWIRIWRIPKPFEWGILFGTIPERIMEYVESKDPEALTSAFGALVRGMLPIDPVKVRGMPIPVPLPIPSGLLPMTEVAANYSFFFDRPVVGMGADRAAGEEQVKEYTGEFARLLGDAFNTSPAAIEHLIRGHTGGVGTMFVEGGNIATREIREAAGMEPLIEARLDTRDPATRVPLLRGFTVQPPTSTNAESVNRFYKDWNKAEGMRLAWKSKIKQGRPRAAAEYYAENKEWIDRAMTKDDSESGEPGDLRATYNAITALKRQRKELLKEPDARQRVTELDWEVIELARQAIGKNQ